MGGHPPKVAEVDCPSWDGTGFARVEQPAQPGRQNFSTALQGMFWQRARASIITACPVVAEAISKVNSFRVLLRGVKMNFSQTKDERLLAFYENIRHQVRLDVQSGSRHRLIGEGVKQYADKLREEMDRRRLQFMPIDWQR